MDIKLKNTNSNDIEIKETKKPNLYSLKSKIILVILICILAFISYNSYIFIVDKEIIYKGYDIENNFGQYCYNVIEARLNLKNEDHIREVYQKKYNVDSNYKPKGTETYTQEQTSIVEDISITEDVTEESHIYAEQNASIQVDEEIKNTIENIVAKRTKDLESIDYDLDRTVNFVYLIKDSKTGNIIDTNIDYNPNIEVKYNDETHNDKYIYLNNAFDNPIQIFNAQQIHASILGGTVDTSINRYYALDASKALIEELNIENEFDLYFALIEPITINPSNGYEDTFFKLQKSHNSLLKSYIIIKIICIISFIIMLILTSILVSLAGRDEKHGEIKLNFVDKIPVEINVLAIGFLALLIFDLARYEVRGVLKTSEIIISILLVLNCLCCVSRTIKAKILIKNSIFCSFLVKLKTFIFNIKYIFESDHKEQSIIFLSVIVFFIIINGFWYGFILIGLSLKVTILLLTTIGLNFIFIMWLINCFASLKKIVQATKEISEGNIEYYIDSSDFTKTMKLLTENIAKIQNGLNEAVKKAVQDEHLKTELITNVSHDLKTPLTSIINYIDLLKKEDLNSDKAYEYLNILDEKAGRLKQLIEDLIEASKASSGSISVLLEKLDLHQLIMQSYGEYENRLSKNNLDVHIESAENQILICADGKHMWRIIANLLSNVSKYALPNSRVYINLSKEDNYALVSIKNISAYQLNVSATHLTERFVRGDSSRTTEGSGLGLSIAQSLTELQGGKFEIFIDGDLFKVNIKIPLWT